MPKSKKHKKERASDFHKRKLKVGKRKQEASNATNTSFTSKAIVIPEQTIGLTRVDEPVTRRNQTINDLLINLKHYNAGTRKDAIQGIREILSAHPHIASSRINSILSAAVRLIGDEDASVRKALRFFLGWYLRACSVMDVAPFCTMLLCYTTSALSHIFPEIRIDATFIVDILLEIAPEMTSNGCLELINHAGGDKSDKHGLRISTAYFNLLGIGTSHTGIPLSPSAKLIVLKSLHRLLSTAVSLILQQRDTSVQTTPDWFYGPFFQNQTFLVAFLSAIPSQGNSHDTVTSSQGQKGEALIHVDALAWNQGVVTCQLIDSFQPAFEAPKALDMSLDHKKAQFYVMGSNGRLLSDFLQQLHPFILATFLDVAPCAFDPSTSSSSETSASALEIIWCLAMLTRDLWRLLAVQMTKNANKPSNRSLPWADYQAEIILLSTLIDKMSFYFAFGQDELKQRDSQGMNYLQDLNLCYCELLSLLALATQQSNLRRPKFAQMQARLDGLTTYVDILFNGQNDRSIGDMIPTLTAHVFAGLLPTLWSLLCHSSLASDILATLLQYSLRLPAASQVKPLTITFLARLFIMEDFHGCTFPPIADILTAQQEQIAAWFRTLPKYLWELGTTNLKATEITLSFLHKAISKPLLRFAPIMADLTPLLIPFFHIPSKPQTRQIAYGPFTRLPRYLQSQALAIAFFVASEEGPNAPLLRSAVNNCSQSTLFRDKI